MRENPLSLTSPGESLEPDRIQAIVWDGNTSANDKVVVEYVGGGLVWSATASGDQTYLGIMFSGKGLSAPKGVRVTRVDNGRVYVYFLE
jgi:hypothetical protein